MGNIKKGVVLGGILAAAAAIGFALSKEGKEMSKEMQEDAKALAADVKRELDLLEDVTKDAFDQIVSTAIEAYAKNKRLAEETKREFTSTLQKLWDDLDKS